MLGRDMPDVWELESLGLCPTFRGTLAFPVFGHLDYASCSHVVRGNIVAGAGTPVDLIARLERDGHWVDTLSTKSVSRTRSTHDWWLRPHLETGMIETTFELVTRQIREVST